MMIWWAYVELFYLHYTLGVLLPNMEKVMPVISQPGSFCWSHAWRLRKVYVISDEILFMGRKVSRSPTGSRCQEQLLDD